MLISLCLITYKIDFKKRRIDTFLIKIALACVRTAFGKNFKEIVKFLLIRLQGIWIYIVMYMKPLSLALHDSCIPQHLEMLRDCWLRDPELVGDRPNTEHSTLG